MTTLQILGTFGLGSLVSAFIIFLCRLIYVKITGGIKGDKDFNRIMGSSMQAMIAVELRREYNEYYENKKYCSMAEKQDFEYLWQRCNELDKYVDPNRTHGVLDDCYQKVMDLPTDKPQIIKNHRGPNR